MGGTALRIIYGNNRFSEDIDLDNINLSWDEFEEVIQQVKRFFEMEGFEIEVRNVARGAFRYYIRFPDILYESGLSPYQEEKLLIQVDTAAQGFDYRPEIMILNKFDVFSEIRVVPLNVLLSQKIYTAVNRKRAKGRDFFDITFLFSRTKPDFSYLRFKMGIDSASILRQVVLERIEDYDFRELASDVAPFIMNKDEIKRVAKFREFWEQVEMD
jgi:predicted nucleotidyltransferase component of viral defense system